ncbi:glycoside hydrolase family 3 protein, partial [bacterium]|nr:glycoside hydrolase family 3 protein [bacterium]
MPTAAPDVGSLPFRNPDLPLLERVTDLVGRLTLEEKIHLIEVETTAIPRLEIASRSWWGEAVHGVSRAGRATMFPQAIAQAATWDPDLIHRMAVVISDEARGKHREAAVGRYRGLNFWVPAADLVRDPRWGRAQETYGEDPHLVGRMVVAFIRGMQGDDPRYLKTAASVKHFGMHSQETDRTGRSFPISERPLHEYYFKPFREAVVEAKVAGCMAAHNGINGVPCHANAWLLTDVLRGQWGFRGPVFTDWCATRFLTNRHQYVP